MPKIIALNEAQLRQAVPLDQAAVECIERGFAALATEETVMPPILHMAIPERNAEVDVKTAFVPGIPNFAIKISPGFFDNPQLGLSSLNGLMVLFNATTGLVDAVLLDNGYLTDVRTAAAGAVAARYLAPAQASHAAILGAGSQARWQLIGLTLVRPITSACIWGRRMVQAQALAAELERELGFEVRAAESIEAAVQGAQVVVCTTPSQTPLLSAEDVGEGMHITAMGSDSPYKNELAPEILTKADRYVVDRLSQCAALGELHHGITAGLVAADATFPELGALAAGRVSGRATGSAGNRELTVCDLTGTGVQDTAIASLALARAGAMGLGFEFDS